ncbi:MAG: DUF2029 domain-containing protein [Erysipelotrichaceae bacterium]|nr:DUF2029 domain-containing protein [Erysipelotrichaceae bacterium]
MLKIGTNRKNASVILQYVLMALIFLWPFVNSFFGIDMGDTGLHTFMFQNLYEMPDFISFTSWFTTFVGHVWLKTFPFLGLWGLNLLEILLEMSIVIIVYQTFKHHINKNCLLIGLFIAILTSNTYLNVFNYHQFNVLLLVILMCLQFKAITKNNVRLSICAGFALGVLIFSRTGSVTAFVTFAFYLFWFLLHEKYPLKKMLRHMLGMLVGFVLSTIVMCSILIGTGQMQYFINNIFRLKGLATASEGGYSLSILLDSFFRGNLDAIEAGLVFFAGIVVVFLASLFFYQYNWKKQEVRKHFILNALIALVFFIVGIYTMVYSFDVNPAPAWPQMTTGPSFLIGVMYVAALFRFCEYVQADKEKSLMVLISIFLPMLTIAGSNTGTKHVIMGMWIIAPVLCELAYDAFLKNSYTNVLKIYKDHWKTVSLKKPLFITFCIALTMFALKLGSTVYYTNNFDSIHRWDIKYAIHSDNAKLLRTTQRQAINVNGVLDTVQKVKQEYGEDVPMLVYGGSVLFYYLSDSKSYVQPWITLNTYPLEKFEEDLDSGKHRYNKLPVIIYGRTNNYYGFYEHNFQSLLATQMSQRDDGKKEVFSQFLIDHDYGCVFESEYYVVFYAGVGGNEESESYIQSILGL